MIDKETILLPRRARNSYITVKFLTEQIKRLEKQDLVRVTKEKKTSSEVVAVETKIKEENEKRETTRRKKTEKKPVETTEETKQEKTEE